jgi:uncharacterized protein (TIGR03435 family)
MKIFSLLITLFLTALPARAQAQQPQFEAASIRLVDAHSLEDMQKGIGVFSVSPFPTNLFTAKFVPLNVIVSMAYGVDGNRISGMPASVADQLYSISAKVDGDAMLTADQMRPLLQQLLAQRLHLAAHRESKLVPGYALVAVKEGAKLQPSDAEDKPFFYILTNGIRARAADMKTFADMLESPAGRPVVDNTGISGRYKIDIHYAPADSQKSDLPDFFTAVQEQLGLKLVPQKVPVDDLVIDHVDRIPTEN